VTAADIAAWIGIICHEGGRANITMYPEGSITLELGGDRKPEPVATVADA
jgi:hypothetical protein